MDDPDDLLELSFPPELRASSDVRRAVTAWLGSRVGPGVALGDVLLVVSELVTNVVRHANTPAQFVLRWDGRCARIEVTDGDPRPPRVPAEAPAVGGRGIFLVERLSESWGSRPAAGGKTVWAAVAVAV